MRSQAVSSFLRTPIIAFGCFFSIACWGTVESKLASDSARGGDTGHPASRIGALPVMHSCDTSPAVVCYRDTARARPTVENPGQNPYTDWVWFALAGDSVEISAWPGASIATSAGQERDSLHNTAGYFRHRIQQDGVLEIWLSLDEVQGDSVPYTLRIARSGLASNASLKPTGETATLNIVSRHDSDQFSLLPLSLAGTVRDRSRWRVVARPYKVALVSDSLYELCRLPCTTPDTVKLTPEANVTRKY